MALEDVLNQMKEEQQQTTALSNSALQSYRVSPDQAAGNIKLAQKTGLPVHVLPELSEEAKLQALTDTLHQAMETAPATARFLSNPQNAQVAHDDVDQLSSIERIFAPFISNGAKIMAGLASNEAVGAKAIDVLTQGRRLFNEDRNGTFQKSLESTANELSAQVAANVKYWDDIAARYGQDDTVSGRLVGGLLKAIAGLPAGIVGFHPVFGGLSAAAETAKAPESDGLQVLTSGTLEAAKLKGLGKIFHAVGETGLGTVGKMGLTGVTMGTQTAAEIAGSQGLGALSSPQGMEELLSSLVTGAALGYSGMSGEQEVVRKRLVESGVDPADAYKVAAAAPVLRPVINDQAKSQEALITRDFFNALGEATGESKLLQRLPEKMREYVQELKKDGPVDNVFVPADAWTTYWQEAKDDPARVAEMVTGDREQYLEALRTGGDLVIPLEDFISKLAGSEHFKGLADDVKLRPGAMTARESEAFREGHPDAVEELRGKIQDNEAIDARERTSFQKVYDDVFGQLQGIFPRDTAERYATLTAVRARTRASRLETDPWTLYQEEPLKVVQPLPEALRVKTVDTGLDPLLDRLRAADIPADENIFGPSLLQFLRDKGLKDQGGELKAKDLNKATRQPGKKNIMREDGLPLDKAREAAVEAGYLKEGADIRDLLDAVDRELRGKPVYSTLPANERAFELKQTLNQLQEELDRRGVDLAQMSNEEVRRQLFQGAEESTHWQDGEGGGKPGSQRGFFSFTPGDPQRVIGILEKADLSTFLHESGHQWLEELRADALRPDAPEQVKADWQTAKERLGIKDLPDDEPIPREAHEAWADQVEGYLGEGKAPSAELSGLFSRFKLWLSQVYRTLKGLNVNLTDEVRGVMDRLLATDEEIRMAQEEAGQRPLFATAEDAGMTEREFQAYRKDAEAGGAHARDVLTGKLIRELKREKETWWKGEKEKVRAEVLDEVKQNPVYGALQEILKGKDFEGNETPGLKMDRAALVEMYGEEFLKRLPKGSATEYLYTSEGGVHPDLLAERYGFSSGDEMIRKMIEAPNVKRFVAAETDLRMKERYGDMRLDGSIADQALTAVHNDHWAEVMRAEIKALKKKAKEVAPYVKAAKKEAEAQGKKDAEATARWYDAERKTEVDKARTERLAMAEKIPPVKTFREAARQQIGDKPVKELTPHLYLAAEQKAAREAFDSAAKGDYETAADARTKQLLNHFLYFEASKAKEQAEEIRKYAVKMGGTKELGKLGKAGQDYLLQMKSILSRYEFVKVSLLELDQRKENLQQFLDRLKDEDNLDLPIPPEIVDEMQKPVNYRELTVDELRGVYDALRMLEHAAKTVNTVRADAEKVQLGDAALRLTLRLQSSIPEKGGRGAVNDSSLSWLEKLKEHAGELDIPVLRPEFLFERMDGGTRGAWHDFFWNRYNEASAHQNRLREKVFPDILELTRSGVDRSQRKYYIESLRGSLSKDDIIAIALNAGNESNRDKLQRGGVRFPHEDLAKPLTDEALQEILSHLTPEDIKVVNGIWKAIEKLRPDAAELARKRTGIEPQWIEASPLEVKNGTLEGGYFPLKYDPRWSGAGEKQADASTLDQLFTRYKTASTRQGYMKERTEFAAPLSLDWQGVTSRHLDEVITDISHWEFATQAQKLLKRADVKESIIDRMGHATYKNLLDWVRYTVNQDSMGREASDSLEKLRRSIRTKASTYILGFKVQNAIADALIGIPLAVQRLDAVSVFHGTMEYLRNPKAVHAFAKESSEYMRSLDVEIDRNLTEALNDLAGKHTMLDDVRRWAIESRVWAYKIAATAAWISGYREAQKKGLDGKEAARYADKVPRMTQDAGRAGDLSAVERNPNMRELTMYIGPTLIQYNNNASAVRRIADQGVNRHTVGNAAKVFLFGYIANAVLYEMLRGRNPDDNEKLPAWLVARLTLGMWDGIPIGRDIAAYAEGKITGEPGKTMRHIPVLEAGKTAVDAVDALAKAATGEGEPRRAVTTSVKAVGAWTGLPALQGTITGEYLYDVLTGQYEPEHAWSPVTDIFNRRKHNSVAPQR